MSRGRSHNEAHVVTDGHDHDEFGLGERAGVAAFADAIRRNPDGELSATTVQERWDHERAVRTFDRAADQLVVYATQMWSNVAPNLPPAAQAKLTDQVDGTVVQRLAEIPTGQWGAVPRHAATHTNWNHDNATTRSSGTSAAPKRRAATQALTPLSDQCASADRARTRAPSGSGVGIADGRIASVCLEPSDPDPQPKRTQP